jgi:glucokinase
LLRGPGALRMAPLRCYTAVLREGCVEVLVGVDIGGTKTAVVVGRVASRGISILGRSVFATEPHARRWQDVRDEIVAQARALVTSHASGAPIAAAGVSCGGPLDSRRGLVLGPPNLPGWDEVPITRELERAMGCRAYLQNDANACALAEWRFGAGRETRNMVFLTFGTGMGAGLILDGRLYEGTNDFAGEVGHVRLAEEGPAGYGKAGSFEGFCSGGGIAQMARGAAERAFAAGVGPSFCPDRAGLAAITARQVGEAAGKGDSLAIEILEECGRHLGRGLAMIIDIINPQRIVIGGIYTRCRSFLQPAMDAELAREALPGAARACEVVPAALGESIGDYACLSVAVDGMARETKI